MASIDNQLGASARRGAIALVALALTASALLAARPVAAETKTQAAAAACAKAGTSCVGAGLSMDTAPSSYTSTGAWGPYHLPMAAVTGASPTSASCALDGGKAVTVNTDSTGQVNLSGTINVTTGAWSANGMTATLRMQSGVHHVICTAGKITQTVTFYV